MLEKEKQKFSEQREFGNGGIDMSLGKYLLILYQKEEEPYCLKIQNSITISIFHHSECTTLNFTILIMITLSRIDEIR